MSDRALVATRKGLFSLVRKRAGEWELSLLGFRGDPVTMVFADPRDGRLYAALNLGHFGVKLHRSDDRGATWKECAVPVYPHEESETDGEGKGKGKIEVYHIARPEAQSVVIHDPSDGARITCFDLD